MMESESDGSRSTPGDDALRELCFCDAVFRERYEGWSVLGRGPWATVVRTRSRDLGHDIALKVFVNLDPELLARVRQEVRAVQVLSTPYVVHIHSLFDRGVLAWFEMELVEGTNLQEELERLANGGDGLPLIRAYEIALATSRCVWHAHRRGVIHRDLKPANVLLPASGQPAAKVSDFGIARLADVVRATPPGTITGTPRFASPEALAGEPVGPAHDVYALGVTMYVLLSGGRLPYGVARPTSIASLRRLQLTERPGPLRTRAPGIDDEVERVVMRSMASEPSHRPSLRRIVLALERAQARLVAANRSAGTPVSVSAWRIALASLGLVAFGLWTRFGRRRDDGPWARGDIHAGNAKETAVQPKPPKQG
jgi:serine/threonine protein kinase